MSVRRTGAGGQWPGVGVVEVKDEGGPAGTVTSQSCTHNWAGPGLEPGVPGPSPGFAGLPSAASLQEATGKSTDTRREKNGKHR